MLDDPEAVAYVYGPGDDDDTAGGLKMERLRRTSWRRFVLVQYIVYVIVHVIVPSSSTRARTFGEVRVTMLDDEDADAGVRTYDGADTRRHGSRRADAPRAHSWRPTRSYRDKRGRIRVFVVRVVVVGGWIVVQRRQQGRVAAGHAGRPSSSSSSRGTSVVGLAALGMVNPETYLPNSRQNSRGRANGGRLRSSQMWGDCDTDTDGEDAPIDRG